MDRSPAPYPATEFSRTPVAVVIDDQEWTARSLDGILGAAGYAVLKAYTGEQATDLVGRVRPDVIFVDLHLPDIDGMELCAGLVAAGMIGVTTPVIAMVPGKVSREERLDALRRGAWEVLGLPFDADELVLRLGAVVRAKQAGDAAREESLVDASTGLYNTRGVLQKLSELRSDASRSGRSLACIVVGPRDEADLGQVLRQALSPPAPEESPAESMGLLIAEAAGDETVTRIWQATRRSDAKGSLGRTVFVVVAPDTDVDGARRLAERIVAGGADLDTGEDAAEADLVAGLFAEGDLEGSPVTAGDFLARATEAFRRAQADPDGPRIFGPDPRPN